MFNLILKLEIAGTPAYITVICPSNFHPRIRFFGENNAAHFSIAPHTHCTCHPSDLGRVVFIRNSTI